MSEVPPVSPPSSESLKLVIVDQSKDALEAARDRADAQLVEELGEGGGFKRFVNGIWKGNIAKEFYRQRYIRTATESIEASQNVLTHEVALSAEARSRAIDATIERFQSDHDEVIHEDAGEKKEIQSDDSEVATAFKDMIRRYAQGDLNDTTLREERTRFMQAYRETHDEETFGRGLVTTDNMMEIARAVMGAVEHGESMDNVISNMQVITGEARGGVRTEARYNKIDSAIDKLSRTKFGSMLGPEIVISSITIGATIAKWGSHSVVGAALKTIAPGAGAGIWAGLRENKRVKDERVQHSREVAMGKEFSTDSKRRAEMEETRYESRTAVDLTDFVRSTGDAEVLEAGGNDALQAALDSLAQVQSRIDLSNRRSIDLISYTDAAAIGDERMELDLARAEVRVALESRLTAEVRTELGLHAEASVADLVSEKSTQYIELLDQDISAKDKAFRSLKARRVAKAAAIGVATGVVGGLVAQEFIAAIDPTRAGLFEQAWGAHNELATDGTQHQTLLEGMVQGDHRVLHTGPSSSFENYSTAEKGLGTVNLSADHTLVENGDGTVNFVDPNGHATINHLPINKDGSFPKDSLDQLKAAGMKVDDHSFDKEIKTTTAAQVSSEQFVQNHLAETTHVKRDLWYANDTPNVYDKNELRVYWGGHGGLTDGGYQLSAAGMKPGGSYEGNQSVDWNKAAASGNLFMSISASVDTQTQTFMVPIGPDGAINIPANSPAGHFFADVNGHAQFTGAYAEVVQTTGVDTNGTVHMRPLATLVGEGGHSPVTDTITTTTTEHHAVYSITTEGYDTTVQNYTEAAPVLPIDSRRSMEAPISRRVGYYYHGVEALSSAEIQRRRQETSPRLLRNPDADLVPGQEFAWYRSAVEKKRGRAYAKSIDAVVHATPELAQLNNRTKTIVQIPVNAAGGAESKNIYNLLTKVYGEQSAESLDGTMIMLHVNWRDVYEGDDTVARQNIAQTRAEIDRAKADRPDLNIAVIETEFNNDEVQNGIIGFIGRKMHDVALFALDTAREEGRISNDDDVLLIRNDADAKGISSNYLRNYRRQFEKLKETDIFQGLTTFDNTKAARLPGLVYSVNFMQSLELLAHVRGGTANTGGANFGVRASTFAAVGGTGFNDTYTSAGSDDVMIGHYIKQARDGALATSRAGKLRYVRGGYQSGKNTGRTKNRKVAQKISARVDTDSDRQEDLYLKGMSVYDVWSPEHGFDENGYKDRDAELNKRGVTSESLRDNPTEVIERIRFNMEALINAYEDSPALVSSALTFAFMGAPSQGYKLIRKKGALTLQFTPAGEEFLINHLTRDAKGRFDSYGGRKQRQLYGRAKPNAKRQPTRQSLISV
jgi:hypothetical protein